MNTRYWKPPSVAIGSLSGTGLRGWTITDVPRYPMYKTYCSDCWWNKADGHAGIGRAASCSMLPVPVNAVQVRCYKTESFLLVFDDRAEVDRVLHTPPPTAYLILVFRRW
jgi:hypothetical protein